MHRARRSLPPASAARLVGLAEQPEAVVHRRLAHDRLERLGYSNVHVTCGDGSLGLPEHAPYDAIAVAAGGPKAPPSLLSQLALGGRLVMPIGPDEASQMLVRITRESETEYRREPLAAVRFVPLIGEEGWAEGGARIAAVPVHRR